jgi:hypothetical protein
MKTAFMVLTLLISTTHAGEEGKGRFIFPLQNEHAHGSTIVELPNGDLLAAWFQGNGERQADDVRIMGARLLKGDVDWSTPFLLADTPEFPDINPVLFLDARQTLWLVWYTVIANQWETSLIKYRTSKNYAQQDGPPGWNWQDVLHVKPGGETERGIQPDDRFVKAIIAQQETYKQSLEERGATQEMLDRWDRFSADILGKARGENLIRKGWLFNDDGSHADQEMGYPYFRRMGWQTKNKAVLIGDRILLPLYSDGLEMSIFAITDDFGAHWTMSAPLVGAANIQASVAKKGGGGLVAYMRDNGPPPQKHPMSFSKDNGLTWSPVRDSQLPNPGSGSDVVTLQNGHWVIAYNDTEEGRHSLAVSLSTDEGGSWKYTRHIELDESKRNRAAYPSIIQGQDKRIHVVYSFDSPENPDGEAIKHISFPEEWIKSKGK